jgi:hypothetical protein
MKQYRITEKYGKFYPEVFKGFWVFKWWSRFELDGYRWQDGQEGKRFNTLEEAKDWINKRLYEAAPPEVVWLSNLDEETEKALLGE